MINECQFGDCRDTLERIKEQGIAIQSCVTSPPYYGLRSYLDDNHPNKNSEVGLEVSPEQFIENLVDIFRKVKEVLSDDGTLWVNIGDSYNNYRPGNLSYPKQTIASNNQDLPANSAKRNTKLQGYKEKDLIGIPWLLARALQQPYYTGKIKKETDRVWIAAIMDGEGSISGYSHDRKDGSGNRTGINVCITNTCTKMLDRANAIFEGSNYVHQTGEGRLGTRDVYRWKISGVENVSNFLSEIYPHLITKKTQAMIAWNLLEFAKDGKKWGHSSKAVEVRQKRQVLVSILSKLNKGEEVDLPEWVIEPPTLYEPGFYLRQDIIWNKPNPMPESVRDRCTKSHEYIFLLSKNQNYYFDIDAIKEPSIDGQGSRRKRSVWDVNLKPYKGAHFATYPTELIIPCILASTRPGDVVLDPFFGSGTTGYVAERTNRNWIGCELNDDYKSLQDERLGRTGLHSFLQD